MSFFGGDISSKQISVKAAASAAGSLVLEDADSSHSVTLKAPAIISTSFDLVLPSAAGTNGQVLTTDGSGNLSWTDNVGGTIASDASNITAGDSEVVIATTTGSITYNSAANKYVAIQENGANTVSFSAGNVILEGSASLRPRPGESTTTISQGIPGRLDMQSGQISFIAPTINFDGLTSVDWQGDGIYSNLLITGDNKVQVELDEFHLQSNTNTTFDIVASNQNLQLRGDHANRFHVTSGQPVSFDLTDNGTADMKFIKSGGATYINMTSTEGSSGVGFRVDSGELEIRNNSSASWTRMTSFPVSIQTVTTNAAVSIPSGCGGVVIKANAPGGGGGGTGQNNQVYGGGGGGGEFAEIYLNGSNLGSNTTIYVDIGVPGAGKPANIGSGNAENGDDATDLIIKLNDGVSNVTVVTLEGGKGGMHGDGSDGWSSGGLGGGAASAATINTGIGYTIPGKVGEGGQAPGILYDNLLYGNGGDSHLGQGGRTDSFRTNLITLTDGINGGGGAGAGRDVARTGSNQTPIRNSSNGGGGIAYIFFY